MKPLLLLLLLASGIEAQHWRAIVGAAAFPDDAATWHRHFGLAVRLPISARWGFEPEIAYLRLNRNHDDVLVGANFTYDFRGRDARTVPYFVAGLGGVWVRDKFPHFVDRNVELSVNTGFGARVYLSENWFIGPEFRIGWEPILRITGSVGYSWSGR